MVSTGLILDIFYLLFDMMARNLLEKILQAVKILDDILFQEFSVIPSRHQGNRDGGNGAHVL